MPNFGLEGYIGLCLYTVAIAALLLSIFWRPIIGLYFLIPLIPLQTVRYRLNDLPLGSSFVYVILLGVALGLLRKHEPVLRGNPWARMLCLYAGFIFVSLCLGSFYLGVPLPFLADDRRLSDWADYMTMPATLLLVTASVKDVRQIKILVVLMCVAGFLLDKSFWGAISGRDFSTYSDELRDEGGAMGYAGVNGLAAFNAQFGAFTLALAGLERRFLWRLAYLGLTIFSALCVMYALSRGAYAAFLAGWVVIGILRQRKLLLLLGVFVLIWTSVVPNAVRMRVDMTYDEQGNLDPSAEARVELWDDALEVARSNVLLGTGYNSYAYMRRVGHWNDTHNVYLKVIVETGIVGLLFFLWLLAKAVVQGFRLFRRAKDPLLAGLGLGLVGWVVAASAANAFGDRWNYFQVQGYFWVMAGLVARALALQRQAYSAEAGATATGTDESPKPAAAIV